MYRTLTVAMGRPSSCRGGGDKLSPGDHANTGRARPAPAPPARPVPRLAGARPEREDYSARRAEAVRIRAAQPAGSSAPATAITTPASASTTSSGPRYTDR